jgi:hypothetical protein
MSETHDQDDLPPKKKPPSGITLGFTLGEVIGSLVWLVPIIAVGALLAWLMIKWLS